MNKITKYSQKIWKLGTTDQGSSDVANSIILLVFCPFSL